MPQEPLSSCLCAEPQAQGRITMAGGLLLPVSQMGCSGGEQPHGQLELRVDRIRPSRRHGTFSQTTRLGNKAMAIRRWPQAAA